MEYVLVRHKVEDYVKWRKVFDQYSPRRGESGFGHGKLFRSSEDRSEIYLLFEIRDSEKVRRFFEEDRFAEVMKAGGGLSQPIVSFLDEGENIDV